MQEGPRILRSIILRETRNQYTLCDEKEPTITHVLDLKSFLS